MQWAAMGGMDDAGFRSAAFGFLRQLAANLHDVGKVRSCIIMKQVLLIRPMDNRMIETL